MGEFYDNFWDHIGIADFLDSMDWNSRAIVLNKGAEVSEWHKLNNLFNILTLPVSIKRKVWKKAILS